MSVTVSGLRAKVNSNARLIGGEVRGVHHARTGRAIFRNSQDIGIQGYRETGIQEYRRTGVLVIGMVRIIKIMGK